MGCLLVIALLAGSCLKKESGCPPADQVASGTDQQMLMEYIDNHSISAIKHNSGLYYSIESFGDGEFPTLCSSIKVDFNGFLTTGTKFEYGNDVLLNMKVLLPGWRIGVPLVKPGGKIKLYLPPSLAYGYQGKKDDNGNQIVPGNSIVIYEVSLAEFY